MSLYLVALMTVITHRLLCVAAVLALCFVLGLCVNIALALVHLI